MKVIINTCFGGFGVSTEAMRLWLERNGITDYDLDDGLRSSGKGHHYPQYVRDNAERDDIRTDPILIAIIEELGTEQASGSMAQLKVVDIPDGVEWFIDDYDGSEHIAERHRTWR